MRPDETADIPCLVVTHGRDEINQGSLSSIIDCDARLKIDVVHNPSEVEQGSFTRFARECTAAGKVRSFTIFDENISNNAVFLYLLENLDRYSCDRVVISDGDIVAPKSLIDEQISILDAHPDVLACGLRLDATAWDDSLVIKQDFVERFNTPRFEAKDYLNTATGVWMTMFRGPELVAILKTLRDNGLRLTDANMKQLGAALFQKQWVATKRSIGRELNREQPDYHDAKAVSTKAFANHSPEPAGSNYATWNHDWVVPASEWRKGFERRVSFPPLPPAVPRFRYAIDSDPVVKALERGEIRYDRGYLANHLVTATKPGLAFIMSDGRCATGLPHLATDRSALFLSVHPEPGAKLADLSEVDLDAVFLHREAADCRAMWETLRRFVRPESRLKGMAFQAEAVRRQLANPEAVAIPHLPASLRPVAKKLQEGGDIDAAEIDDFVNRLWTDEMLADWFKDSGKPLVIRKSLRIETLVSFEGQF